MGAMPTPDQIRILDSHTEGEPTRVVLDGLPVLVGSNATERAEDFRTRHADLRASIVQEPRGHEAMVGALLLPADNPTALAQVIFFNNVSTLGMCIHGTIGVAETLARLGRLPPGPQTIETPVGDVTIERHGDGSVSVQNVTSFLFRENLQIEVSSFGQVEADVAYGGNWFLLIEGHGPPVAQKNLHELMAFSSAVLESGNVRGLELPGSGLVDHVEIFGPPKRPDAHSKNFVLCPGHQFDRSPCGTGTSAKLATLASKGLLKEGQEWVQESIIGSSFRGTVRATDGGFIPTIRGHAWITGEATLHLHPEDPFRSGIRLHP